MSNSSSTIFAFLFGAAVGSVVAWKLLKTKYEQIAQEEIDSYKEYIESRNEETHASDKDIHTDIVTECQYVSSDDSKTAYLPYVIPPDEFDEKDGYEAVTLTYYSDGVLTDEFDNPIENVDSLVGRDSLDTFGDYEDDSVYVRNDEFKKDFEILLDPRPYSSIKKV